MVLTNTNLQAADLDDPTASLIYRVTALPTKGAIKLNGTALSVGDTFTQAYTRPDTVKLGFSASTGGAIDAHDIANLSVSIPSDSAYPIGSGEHALTFSSGSVTAAHTAALAPTSALTVEAWIQVTGDAAGETILSKMSGSALTGYRLTLDATGKVVFDLGDGAAATSLTGATAVNDGKWHHVVGAFDNGVTSMTLYVDNSQDATRSTSAGALGASTSNLTIGNDGASAHPFVGSINDVQIWSGARTSGQVTADGSHRLLGNESGLVGYWKFDETSGGTALGAAPGTPSGTSDLDRPRQHHRGQRTDLQRHGAGLFADR